MVRELSSGHLSSNVARTSRRSRAHLQVASVLSKMRPDEKRDTIQLAASLALREALSLPSAAELGIMATGQAGCTISGLCYRHG
jgi:hypothetical protein